MQINSETVGELLRLQVAGRLDNESAGLLTEAIDQLIRTGSHTVLLDLEGVPYVSSAGIGALIRAQRKLQSVQGFFGIGWAPPMVLEVIRLSGLGKLLLCDGPQILEQHRSAGVVAPGGSMTSRQAGMSLETFVLKAGAELRCSLVGNPEFLLRPGMAAPRSEAVEFSAANFGLGMGAFGHDDADARDRFGEFLAAAGAAITLPARRSSKPDYQIETGRLKPRLQVLYGLKCSGEFSMQTRFEPAEPDAEIRLSSLVDLCLGSVDAPLAGMVLVAETSGLLGAAVHRSPSSSSSGESRFRHPEIREWLSFTPEHVAAHSIALVVGVACRQEFLDRETRLAPFLRRLSADRDVAGHFHAAVFSYRPLKRRQLDLAETVMTLVENEELQTVLHLLNDDRPILGGGESQFLRGGCWIGPIRGLPEAT